MPRIPTLVTERLVLRPPSPGDLEDVIRLNGDPEVMRYITPGQSDTRPQAAHFWETMLNVSRHGFVRDGAPDGLPGWLTVIERDTQNFIGLGILQLLPPQHALAVGPDYCGDPAVEVGYRFVPEAWGKGYATEVARALVGYGFSVLKVPEIVGIANVENLASDRVLEKVGLELKKTYKLGEMEINFRKATYRSAEVELSQ